MSSLPSIGLGTANLLQSNLPDFIEIAAKNGFRRITVRPYAFMEALRQGFTEAGLRRRLADAGLEVTMIDGLNNGVPGVPVPAELDASTRAQMPPDVLTPVGEADSLRAASALGAPMLNVVAYLGRPVPVAEMADYVGGLCRRAAETGVAIAMEFLRDSGIPDLDTASRIREACGEPNCGILLDVFHLSRSGGTLDGVRGLPPRAISAVQISDCVPASGEHAPFGGRLMPGEGNLPLGELVAAALQNNPDASVDIEVLNQELRNLPAGEAARRLAEASAAWCKQFESAVRSE